MSPLKCLGIAATVLVVLAGERNSRGEVVLTFEGQSNTIYVSPIVRDGYVLGNPVGQEQHFHEIDSTAFPGFVPNNGTGVLYNDRDTQLFVEAEDGSTFYLLDVDAATDLGGPGGSASTLKIIGYLANVETGSIEVPIDGSYITVSGLALGAVDRLIFDGIVGGFTLDNMRLSPVPEPSSLALGGLAILTVAGWRGRRILRARAA